MLRSLVDQLRLVVYLNSLHQYLLFLLTHLTYLRSTLSNTCWPSCLNILQVFSAADPIPGLSLSLSRDSAHHKSLLQRRDSEPETYQL